jgi:hypothetical protein
MPIFTTTSKYQLFNASGQVLAVLDLPIGETVEYSDAIYSRTEHNDTSSLISYISSNGLSVDPNALSSLGESIEADVRAGAGLDLLLIDFQADSIGSLASAKHYTTGMSGAGAVQPNGVSDSLVNDQMKLVGNGFTKFMVMRPGIAASLPTTMETHRVYAPEGPRTLDILVGSTGILEQADTLAIYLIIDGQQELVASLGGDIESTIISHSFNLSQGSDISIRIESLCGDGPQEGHVVGSIALK